MEIEVFGSEQTTPQEKPCRYVHGIDGDKSGRGNLIYYCPALWQTAFHDNVKVFNISAANELCSSP